MGHPKHRIRSVILERLAWSSPDRVVPDAATDTAMMARFAIYVAIAGSTLGLLALSVNWSGPRNPIACLVLALLTYVLAAGLLVGFDRLPAWCYQLIALVAITFISLITYFADPGADLGAFYLTVTVAVFFFFPWQSAALQVVAIAVTYGVVLALQRKPTGTALTSWISVVGVVVTVGFLVKRIRSRVDWLVKRLDDMARTDPLTGLLNRRGFGERFRHELERARRSNDNLSIVVGDLDNFKQINDQFGHDIGDAALTGVSALFGAGGKRAVDTVGRLGGEEFAILLPETDWRGAYTFAERLRHQVARSSLNVPSGLTISFGVATFPFDGGDADQLLHAADRALYAAKDLGRNRTVVFRQHKGSANGRTVQVRPTRTV